jgi:hypothetical protein
MALGSIFEAILSGKNFSSINPIREKPQRVISWLLGEQKHGIPTPWESEYCAEITYGLKVSWRKSKIMSNMCNTIPSCVNHCCV